MSDPMNDITPEDDLDLAGADCNYDPLEEVEEKDADERAETFGYRGSPDEVASDKEAPELAPQVPARERIARLLSGMAPFRRMLLSVLDACREPQNADRIEEVVAGLEGRKKCVYGAASFCTMLEAAGALCKLTADGEPYEEVEPQLVEVQEDGRTFLRPTEPPEVLWQATPEGLEALEEDDPLGELLQIVQGPEAAYAGVFAEILGMCDGDGSSINEIKQQINPNPALAYPRKMAQFFMDYLDRNDAIEWDGAWKITEVGRKLLDYLQNE